MATTVKLPYEGKEYILGFNRETVKRLEAEGFVPSELVTKPMTYLPMLFRGAFYEFHRKLKPEFISEIYIAQRDKDKLIEVLAQMYNEPLSELFDEPEEDADEGNAHWEVSKK